MKRTTFLIIIFISVFSCRKNDEKKHNSTDSTLAGKVILPPGSPINVNNLTVLSVPQETKVTNGLYSLDTSSAPNFSTQFVTNSNGEPMLMRYHYPGMPNNDFTSQSTALAVLMNFPSTSSLSKEGKQNLINKIQTVPAFKEVSEAIDKFLLKGISFSTATDSSFYKSVAKMFESASTLRVMGDLEEPIIIGVTGNQIGLINNVIACPYVAGLYKDGQQVGPLKVIKGFEVFPSSLPNLLAGLFDVVTLNPALGDIAKFDMVGNGMYNLKVRSGRINDNTKESDSALFETRYQYYSTAFSAYFSFFSSSDCITSIKNGIRNSIKEMAFISRPKEFTSKEALIYFMEGANIALSFIDKAIDGCTLKSDEKAASKKYIVVLKAYLGVVDIVAKLGAAANMTMQVKHFITAKPKIDTCFTVSNGIVTSCNIAAGEVVLYDISYQEPYLVYKVKMLRQYYSQYACVARYSLNGQTETVMGLILPFVFPGDPNDPYIYYTAYDYYFFRLYSNDSVKINLYLSDSVAPERLVASATFIVP